MEKTESNNTSERLLVEGILNGRTDDFRQIIDTTQGLVAQIIFKMIRNEEDRKDIVQEVYLKVFKALPKFRFHSKLSTWIGQVTYNTCLNYLEKKKLVLIDYDTEEPGPQDAALELLTSGAPSSAALNEIEMLIHRKELSVILTREIDKLSPVYRTLITLYHYEEMSYAQIGEMTQLPEGTVKNYLFRARKRIMKNLSFNYKKEEL